MKEVILAVLKKAANRTQVLGDNRMHDLIVDDDFEELAMRIRLAVVKELSSSVIFLTSKETQSGNNRVRWAEGLIKQLPEDHDGRNSWLLNYSEANTPVFTPFKEE